MTITPDTKDWTWVLRQACPECGLVASAVNPTGVAGLVRGSAQRWADVLTRTDVRERPDPATWSPLEYGCHVRDVFEVFCGRVQLMLADVDPQFDNWDQDQTAQEQAYSEQDPYTVGEELAAHADRFAALLDQVGDGASDQWTRTGHRSNGSDFTVATLAQYGWHDVYHHLHDVGDRGR